VCTKKAYASCKVAIQQQDMVERRLSSGRDIDTTFAGMSYLGNNWFTLQNA